MCMIRPGPGAGEDNITWAICAGRLAGARARGMMDEGARQDEICAGNAGGGGQALPPDRCNHSLTRGTRPSSGWGEGWAAGGFKELRAKAGRASPGPAPPARASAARWATGLLPLSPQTSRTVRR